MPRENPPSEPYHVRRTRSCNALRSPDFIRSDCVRVCMPVPQPPDRSLFTGAFLAPMRQPAWNRRPAAEVSHTTGQMGGAMVTITRMSLFALMP